MATAGYSWGEYKVFMGARFITGIRGFKYKAARKKEAVYAEGDKPVGVGYGNYEYSGEIKVLQSELEAMILSAKAQSPGGDLLSLPPFRIVHTYSSKSVPGLIVSDVAEDCEFMDVEKAMEQGQTFMEVTLPIYIGNVRLGVPL